MIADGFCDAAASCTSVASSGMVILEAAVADHHPEPRFGQALFAPTARRRAKPWLPVRPD